MTYLVLARKWRPRSFETLVGQEHVVRALSHALTTQRLHHAWLFTGTRGVGKTTLSRILAKSLNCETGITPTPCGVCRACTEIDAGRFVDYLELDAASNRGVDEMTQLLEQAVYSPTSGRFKVYMIDEVHMLTGHAFNAMLKTLEEPPPHVKFILATTDPQKIPVTVLSRCLQFNLKQMPPESIVGHLDHVLQEEQMPFETPALRLIGQAARGSMRDALSLTDQAIAYSAGNLTEEAVRGMLGTIDQRHLVRLLDAVALADGPGVVAVADELSLRSLSYAGALADLAVLLSRIALAQRVAGTVPDDDPLVADIARLASTLSPDHVQLFYSVAVHSRAELALAPDEYAGFVMACLRMLAFTAEPGDSPAPAPSKPPAARAAPLRAPSPVAAASRPAPAPGAGVASHAPVAGAAAVSQTPVAAAAGAEDATVAKFAPVVPPGTTGATGIEASAAPVVPPGTTGATGIEASAAPVVPPGTTGATGIEASAAPVAPALPIADRSATAADVSVAAADESPAAIAPLAPAVAAAPARLSPSAAALQAANAALQRSGPGGTRGGAARSASPAGGQKPSVAVPVSAGTRMAGESATTVDSAAPSAASSSSVPAKAPAAPDVQAAPANPVKPDVSDSGVTSPASLADAAARPTATDGPQVQPAQSQQQPQSQQPQSQQPQSQQPQPQQPQPQPPSQSPSKAAPRAEASPVSEMDAFEAYASQGPDDDFSGYSGQSPDDEYDDYPTTGKPPATRSGAGRAAGSRAAPPARPAASRPSTSAGAPVPPALSGRASPATTRGASPADVVDVPDTPGASGASEASDASPASSASPGTITLTEPWATLAARLPLRGLAAQLAQQSEWVTVDGATVVLRVATKTLAEGAGVERLRIVLETHFGQPVRLRFEIGKTGDNTAYAAAVSERQARQEAAEQTIMADPFVRDLLDQFGGKIVPDSIRPVTPEAQQGTPS